MDDLMWDGVASRADELSVETGAGSSNGFRFQTNSTSAFSNELEFAAAKSVRTSIVILASFNAIAAFTTAVGIYWDCYASAKRKDGNFRLRSSFWKIIGPAETFPFILCFGIIGQAIVFAVAQSMGLEALMILGCTSISQSVLPATLSVPYLQMVFGLETTLRASWRQPFPRRPKWSTTSCIAVAIAAILATALVTRIDRAPNFCFASLFWFIQRWMLACFGILISVIGTSLIGVVVVFLRLRQNTRMDPTERVAASWMVYFMAVAVVSNTLLIPFFYTISFGDASKEVEGPIQMSTVASVVSNLSGLVTGALYLFLRSSRFATISPEGYHDSDRQSLKKGIRIWAPSNYTYTNQMARPVSPLAPYQGGTNRQEETEKEERSVESPTGTPTYEQANPLGSNTVRMGLESPRRPPTAWTPTNGSVTSANNASAGNGKTFSLLPAATYTPATIQVLGDAAVPALLLPPPPALFGADGARHRRDSSMASSATVQIGLRLSNINAMAPVNPTYAQESNQVHDLGCPNFKGPRGSRKVSPLATHEVNGGNQAQDLDSKPLPIPRDAPGEDEHPQDEEVRLSPTVYSPQDSKPQPRVTTPLGIGFDAITRESTPAPQMPDRKADWI